MKQQLSSFALSALLTALSLPLSAATGGNSTILKASCSSILNLQDDSWRRQQEEQRRQDEQRRQQQQDQQRRQDEQRRTEKLS